MTRNPADAFGLTVGDPTLAHLRSVVDQPDVTGTRYVLVEHVGRGGMGTVWRARDVQLDRDVALKVLTEPEPMLAREMADRLVREAKVIARLEHPGIVPVHDAGVLQDGRAYYAMKLVVGRRLDEILGDNPTEPERLRIFARMCEAVAFAHACGIVHSDLKPANVMVGPFGEVLVLDWGLARVGDAQAQEPALVRAGTEGFMAPEQKLGTGALDPRVDVFALGRVLAELSIGARETVAIVAKATAQEPSDRYERVLDLLADVERFQAGERVEAVGEGLAPRLRRFYRKYRAAVWLVGTYAVLRLGFEVVRIWMHGRNP